MYLFESHFVCAMMLKYLVLLKSSNEQGHQRIIQSNLNTYHSILWKHLHRDYNYDLPTSYDNIRPRYFRFLYTAPNSTIFYLLYLFLIVCSLNCNHLKSSRMVNNAIKINNLKVDDLKVKELTIPYLEMNELVAGKRFCSDRVVSSQSCLY